MFSYSEVNLSLVGTEAVAVTGWCLGATKSKLGKLRGKRPLSTSTAALQNTILGLVAALCGVVRHCTFSFLDFVECHSTEQVLGHLCFTAYHSKS